MVLCGEIEQKAHNLDGKNVRFVLFLSGEEGDGGSGGDGAFPPNNSKKRRKNNVKENYYLY